MNTPSIKTEASSDQNPVAVKGSKMEFEIEKWQKPKSNQIMQIEKNSPSPI